jgi:ABC-type dipeptide/oligopeptide/nickel transport system permease subunit
MIRPRQLAAALWPRSRVARLWAVMAAAALVLLIPAHVLPRFADRDKAFGIRVDQALERPLRGSGEGFGDHWFGTDTAGRSLWHRTLLGAGLSFRVVVGALALALPLSLVLGATAGLNAGRWPDKLISWMISLIYTVPFFLLVVSLSAIVRPGLETLPWIIGGVIWAAPARVVRSEAQRLAASGFLRQERAMGHRPLASFFRTVLPMLLAPAAVSLLYLVPEIIGIDAVLTLFGLGANPPEATLGALIYDGLKRWDSAWWLSGLPTIFLFVIAVSVHHLADRLGRQLRGGRNF